MTSERQGIVNGRTPSFELDTKGTGEEAPHSSPALGGKEGITALCIAHLAG